MVAKRSDVSLSTVYRILTEHPSLRKVHDELSLNVETLTRRDGWLTALRKHQDAGVGVVRATAAADYAWLYRHDHAWLSSIAPTHQHKRRRPRVDWAKRDKELTQKLHQHLAAWRDEAPPVRVTKTRLMRSLGEAMVRHNEQNLPNLYAELHQATESHEAFQTRRVSMAIAVLARTGPDFQLWRVKKIAGLRHWSRTLIDHACKEIELLNAQSPLHSNSLP